MLSWQVPYQAGQLKATGFKEGKPVTESMLITADVPAEINLTADRTVLKADGQDLAFIHVALVDRHGVINPVADRQIEFKIAGTGKMAAVASANPTSTESFQLPKRKTWRGQCMVIVQAGKEKGDIYITAHSESLPDKLLMLRTE
jgi:beta-galactosidase